MPEPNLDREILRYWRQGFNTHDIARILANHGWTNGFGARSQQAPIPETMVYNRLSLIQVNRLNALERELAHGL